MITIGLAISWPYADWPVIVAAGLVLAAVLAEPAVLAVAPRVVDSVGLGALPVRLPQPPLTLPTGVAAVIIALWPLFHWPSWPMMILILGPLAWGGARALRLVRSRRRRAEEAALATALAAYAPSFAVYFAAKPEAAYQLTMWLPYLERVGPRFVVIIRDPALLEGLAQRVAQPVIAVSRVEALALLLPDSVGAMFYVNNDAKNADGVRMNGPTHVHLGHGDSEKPPSYTPTTAMFDRIFVAGQAGIDRFARHGVAVPLEKFVMVGRPQLEAIEPAGAVADQPTVLYAPTWRGGLYDMQFGSLEVGERIVDALLGLGARVIFRPHPYSARDAESRVIIGRIDAGLAARGGDHLGSAEAAALAITDCFNLSTATVTDVSSVASDYLFSGKPLAIVRPAGAAASALADYPFLNGCYLLDRDGDPGPALRSMLVEDPLAPARAEQRRYYLGATPAQGYATAFVDACRRAIDEPSPRRLAS